MVDRVAFGVPVYGPQPSEWWGHFSATLATLPNYGIQYAGTYTATSMATDGNRNSIAASFLAGDAEWLMWVDADNTLPLGAVRRLLDNQKSLVSGLYFLKGDPPTPVAYERQNNGRYSVVSGWRRGEIIPIDMAGMGACLCHRSVLEDIRAQCVVVERWDGSLLAMHKDDVSGELPDHCEGAAQVVGGVMNVPVRQPSIEVTNFPYFILSYGRTEDLIFYELAARCGHKAWLDTSVEAGHVGGKIVTGSHYREWVKRVVSKAPRITEHLVIQEDIYNARS